MNRFVTVVASSLVLCGLGAGGCSGANTTANTDPPSVNAENVGEASQPQAAWESNKRPVLPGYLDYIFSHQPINDVWVTPTGLVNPFNPNAAVTEAKKAYVASRHIPCNQVYTQFECDT